MAENRKENDDRSKLMDLDGIEGLLQQVDVMVGVGSLSPFPEAEAGAEDVVEEAASSSASGEDSEAVFDELDAFETMASPVQYVKGVELTLSARDGIDLRLHALRKGSERNLWLLREAVDDPSLLVDFFGIAVLPGQVFARVVTRDRDGVLVAEEKVAEAENDPAGEVIVEWREERIEAGEFVVLEGGEYRAERYGYLQLAENRFSVVAPFFVTGDRLQAHWGIFSQAALGVTPAMLHSWFDTLGIKPEFIDLVKVERLLEALEGGEPKRGAFLVAMGKKPVDGTDGRVELVVPMERPAGIERADGSVDFREVNYLPNVEVGQLVAHRVPPIAGTPGMDVTGGEIPPTGGDVVPLKTDKTVRVVKGSGVELCYAAQAGVVRYDGQALSVVNILTLEKGVNYETGNITFAGDVFIKGTVAEGFSVHAGGDVTVAETVSEGAEIVSKNGNITVGRGVVGKRTKIVARGAVRLQFVHDATIRAGGEIVVGNYLYNAVLFADATVEVRKGEGARGGSIWGGRTVALHGIEMGSAGSPSWIATELVAGFDPEAAEKRQRVDEAIVKSSQHLSRILDVFGLSRLDPARIRAATKQAEGSRRRLLEQQARLLGQLAKSYKSLLEMRQNMEAAAVSEKAERARIKVRGTAYPEVTVRIRRQTLRLDREYDQVTFKQGEKGIEAV